MRMSKERMMKSSVLLSKTVVVRTFALLALVTMTACQFKVPVAEMTEARSRIDRAEEVQAEKYAAQDYAAAKTALLKSHEQIKAEDADKAKDEAVKARDLAQKAIDASLPLLAGDSIAEAENAIIVAKSYNSEEFAPELSVRAIEKLSEATEHNEKQEYWPAHLRALDAQGDAKAALDKAKESLPALKEAIANDLIRAEELSSSADAEAAQDEIVRARDGLNSASDLLEKPDVPEAVKIYREAKEALDNAENRIRLAEMAKQIEELREEGSRLQAHEGFRYGADELESARKILEEAAATAESGDREKAARLLAQARDGFQNAEKAMNGGMARADLDEASDELAALKAMSAASSYQEDLVRAENLVTESGIALNEERYTESRNLSAEATSLLSSLREAMQDHTDVADNTSGDEAGGSSQPDDGSASGDMKPAGSDESARTYVVKYRKKNTDCLWRIAQNVYSDARLWPLIYAANRERIKDPDLIFPGQELVIPPKPEKKEGGDGDESMSSDDQSALKDEEANAETVSEGDAEDTVQ